MSKEMIEFTAEKKKLLKQTLCKSLTSETELELFLHTCTRLGLDPFMKQIYAVKRGDTMTIQTGIDGYRLIAERSGRYMPGKEPTFTYDKEGNLFSATSYVKKLGPDNQWHEVACTAIYREYAPVYQGKISGMWKDKGHLMLAKCAESAALRRAFPAEMAGVYTDEEMEQADKPITELVDVSSKPIVVEDKEPVISVSDAIKIEQMIGLDKEYRARILGFYKKQEFTEVPLSALKTILEKVELHNQEKAKELEELA